MIKIRFYSFIRIPMPRLFLCLCGAISERLSAAKHPLLDVNPVGSTFNIQNSIPHKSQKPKAVAEINSPIEFQRGTAGVPESAKECDTVLPEGLDIGLGPGDRAFESHYSDQNPSEINDFRGGSILLTVPPCGGFSHPLYIPATPLTPPLPARWPAGCGRRSSPVPPSPRTRRAPSRAWAAR